MSVEHSLMCCRLCADAIQMANSVDLYEETSIKDSLIVKIHTCLPIRIKVGDGLPTRICTHCVSRLEDNFAFVEDSLRGQVKLKCSHHRTTNRTNGNHGLIDGPSECSEVSLFLESDKDSGRSSPPQFSDFGCWNAEDGSCDRMDTDVKVETEGSRQKQHSDGEICRCESCQVARYGSLPLLVEVIEQTERAFTAPSTKVVTAKDEEPDVEIKSEQKPASVETTRVPSSGKDHPKTLLCDFCPRTFTHTGDFNKHRRSHTGEQPYQCKVCHKRFSHTSNLLRHNKVHTGEKPYACTACGRNFARRDKLIAHSKRLRCSSLVK